jgi:site-specific DNA-methyltransferase (adenine-specific)
MSQKVIEGDNLATLKTYPDNYFDAVVTDPPYGLSFMGKKWDYDVPRVELWAEVFRVLKPGGHLLAFAGTRTQHRMAVNIEDAGFEIRDLIAWVYGSGFPKSLDISKAIDKAAGAEREITGKNINLRPNHGNNKNLVAINQLKGSSNLTAPATDAAKEWDGWGTALKPALEPITVARKPIETTVAANVLKYGTGGLNIDGARVNTNDELTTHSSIVKSKTFSQIKPTQGWQTEGQKIGRWPANLIHDGSEEVFKLFPETGPSSDTPRNRIAKTGENGIYGIFEPTSNGGYNDNGGSAARFFYCPKASKSERDNGLKGFEPKTAGVGALRDGGRESEGRGNFHPTVKPVDLMRYLVKLVTPKGGTVLDPFNGSGTTGVACKLEGFNYVGLEFDSEYCKISRARIENYVWNPAPEPEPTAPNQLNLFE